MTTTVAEPDLCKRVMADYYNIFGDNVAPDAIPSYTWASNTHVVGTRRVDWDTIADALNPGQRREPCLDCGVTVVLADPETERWEHIDGSECFLHHGRPVDPAKQPKNLAQFKRDVCQALTKVHITNRRMPWLTRDTVVTRSSTVDLITRGHRKDGRVIEHSHLGLGKASEWRFDEHGCHNFQVNLDGTLEDEPWLTVVVL